MNVRRDNEISWHCNGRIDSLLSIVACRGGKDRQMQPVRIIRVKKQRIREREREGGGREGGRNNFGTNREEEGRRERK